MITIKRMAIKTDLHESHHDRHGLGLVTIKMLSCNIHVQMYMCILQPFILIIKL